MQTDKKNAISYDQPKYLLGNQYSLLQKNQRNFFYSRDKNHHPIKMESPAKTPNKNMKYGLSKDSPFLSKFSQIHRLTPSLFSTPKQEDPKKQQQSYTDSKLLQKHISEYYSLSPGSPNNSIPKLRKLKQAIPILNTQNIEALLNGVNNLRNLSLKKVTTNQNNKHPYNRHHMNRTTNTINVSINNNSKETAVFLSSISTLNTLNSNISALSGASALKMQERRNKSRLLFNQVRHKDNERLQGAATPNLFTTLLNAGGAKEGKVRSTYIDRNNVKKIGDRGLKPKKDMDLEESIYQQEVKKFSRALMKNTKSLPRGSKRFDHVSINDTNNSIR
jgi:hypothetical protein